MILKAVLLVTSVLFLTSNALCLAAVECYIAPAPFGSDSNPGTQEQPFATIQKGIDTATDGHTVIVAKGTYVENIQFKGKSIILRSAHPKYQPVVESTVIDGNRADAVVTFSGDEHETCVLSGFTIRNGGRVTAGGGIHGGARIGPLVRGSRTR